MSKTRPSSAFSLFVFSLLLLLMNDFYLKQAFHNPLTGKLSDLAGLLVFPWFWSMFFKKYSRWVYLSTALFFIFWKLDWSEDFIQFINSTFGFTFSRVVDKTDLWALLVLPISYKLLHQSEKSLKRVSSVVKYSVSFLSVFAFFATSQPELYVEPNWEFNTTYTLPFSKEDLLTKQMYHREVDSLDANFLGQTEFNIIYQGEFELNFNATILEKDSTTCELTLNKLLNYSKKGVSREKKDGFDKQKFLAYFENEVIPNLSKPVVEYSRFTVLSVVEL